jgi:hypothetical protein
MPVEVAPVKAVAMRKPVSAVPKAAAVDNMRAAKATAVKCRTTTPAETSAMKGRAAAAETATVKCCATTVETSPSAAVETAPAMASATVATTAMTSTAMTAADFGR